MHTSNKIYIYNHKSRSKQTLGKMHTRTCRERKGDINLREEIERERERRKEEKTEKREGKGDEEGGDEEGWKEIDDRHT